MKRNIEMRLTPAALVAAAHGDMHNALMAMTPGGIEAQEKAGQALLVASTNMPKEMHPSREAFEKVGFKFGNEVDELFLTASLPSGWKRVATDHSMHSTIVDEQGFERVSIFYKAAFYDRRADASLVRRYQVGTIYPDATRGSEGLAEGEVILTITDGGKEIQRFPAVKRAKQFDGPRDEAAAWLKAKFPNADDPTAYW
jgi:hypothetical protein